MRISSSLILGLLVWSNLALAQQAPNKEPELEIVDCKTLEGFSKPILADLGVAVRCRLEPASLICLPGARLKADITGIIDLCVNATGRPIHSPRCIANRPKVYNQAVIERSRHRVETANGIEYRWLDLPFSIASRKEALAQTKPIHRLGADVCVYLRKEKIYMTRAGRPAMPTPPSQ